MSASSFGLVFLFLFLGAAAFGAGFGLAFYTIGASLSRMFDALHAGGRLDVPASPSGPAVSVFVVRLSPEPEDEAPRAAAVAAASRTAPPAGSVGPA